MKALILSAGRGSRLRPFTDTCPKPLLPVGTHRLCDWQIAALVRAGVRDLVMNLGHLAGQFRPLPAELAPRGVRLSLSYEADTAEEALESLGGIVRALPMLTDGTEPFFVCAGDVAHDVPLTLFTEHAGAVRSGALDAVMLAVPNPPYHPQGDLSVGPDGSAVPGPGPWTYGCVLLCAPRLFAGLEPVRAKLFPWLWSAVRPGRLRVVPWTGWWANVGDPPQYLALCADAAHHKLADF